MRHDGGGRLRTDLEWLKRNLDEQLADHELERDGLLVRCYFDTYDLVRSIQGLSLYYSPSSGLNRKAFDSSRALVHRLAASGALGAVELTVPHQAEFLALLEDDLDVGLPRTHHDDAEAFLNALEITEGGMKARRLSDMSDDELRALVVKEAGRAERLFKAVEAVSDTWIGRLTRMRRDNVLLLNTGSGEFAGLLRAPTFVRVREALRTARPDVTINNLADAAAIELLAMQVAKCRAGQERVVPRFLSTPIFDEVVESAQVAGRLILDVGGHRASVLRGTDYFVLRAIFRLDHDGARPMKATLSLDAMEDVRQQLGAVLRDSRPLDHEAVSHIRVGGQGIEQLVQSLRNYTFLENLWLPYLAQEEIRVAVEGLRRFGSETALLDDERFRDFVDEAIASTKRSLGAGTARYAEAASLLHLLEERLVGLWRSIGSRAMPADLFREFGLVRFQFDDRTCQSIGSAIQVVFSGNAERVSSVTGRIVGAWVECRHEDSCSVSDVAVAVAILWIARLDSYIEQMPLGDSDVHPSLRIVYAAAKLRMGLHEEAEPIINALVKQGENGEEAGFDLSLAYLHFHWWQSVNRTSAWRINPGQPVSSESPLATRAIEYARYATDNDLLTQAEHAYSINILLYYMVEAGSDARLSDMTERAEELTRYRGNPGVWQYRFADTLARYYHRMSQHAENASAMLIPARRWIEEAHASAPWDPEVAQYIGELDLAEAKLNTRK